MYNRIVIVNSRNDPLHLPEQARKSSYKHGIHPLRTESHPGRDRSLQNEQQKHTEEGKSQNVMEESPERQKKKRKKGGIISSGRGERERRGEVEGKEREKTCRGVGVVA